MGKLFVFLCDRQFVECASSQWTMLVWGGIACVVKPNITLSFSKNVVLLRKNAGQIVQGVEVLGYRVLGFRVSVLWFTVRNHQLITLRCGLKTSIQQGLDEGQT